MFPYCEIKEIFFLCWRDGEAFILGDTSEEAREHKRLPKRYGRTNRTLVLTKDRHKPMKTEDILIICLVSRNMYRNIFEKFCFFFHVITSLIPSFCVDYRPQTTLCQCALFIAVVAALVCWQPVALPVL